MAEEEIRMMRMAANLQPFDISKIVTPSQSKIGSKIIEKV
jgi:hypothetical protein